MKFVLVAALLVLSFPAAAQEVVNDADGFFVCDERHPRCSTPDPATYPYHQFGNQNVGDYVGVSDVLEPGPSLAHYQTFLAELISRRADTNAVAFWADAASVVDRGRVWGGFLSARSGFSIPGADSQLIGLEIDVLNGGLPGVYPNASKVGLQIVGFGNPNTNAIEIATETASAAFQNIINIQPNSVAREGAVIGMAPQVARRGIDFQGSSFSDAAFLVSANQRFVFRSPGLGDAAIWRDDIYNGYLVLQAGPPGLRIVNSENNTNLMIVQSDGDVITRYGSLSSVFSRLARLEQATGLHTGDSIVGQAASPRVAAGIPSFATAEVGEAATAVGDGVEAAGARSVAVGAGSAALASRSTAVGADARSGGAGSVALGAGSSDDGEENVVAVGSASQTRRITHVGAGTIDTDAANLGQVHSAMSRAIASANAYADTRFNQLSYDLRQVRRDAEGATASAMALAGIPQAFEASQGMIGMGVGTWQGESAFAVGASKASDDGRLVFKVGGTYNSRGQGGANGGVGLAF
ncbi:YadA family autotransporter adhesin [Novosphingobium soli]|uniref:YadA family autotransporter adhesin n=1 Tax=Novosphingobium soli TaxID=574956 RepID=A0ABV6CVX1_9SPHN